MPPALPRPAGVHLRLHDDDRRQLARSRLGLGGRGGEASGRHRRSPNSRSSSFAWYSWTFTASELRSARRTFARARPTASKSLRSSASISTSSTRSTPPGAEHAGNADVESVDAVLALEQARTGQHALLVPEDRLGHLDGRERRRDEGRARLQQPTTSPPAPLVRSTMASMRSCEISCSTGMPATVQ